MFADTPIQQIADSHDEIVLALIALVATAVGILGFVIRSSSSAKVAAVQATAANSAVNGVGPEHRLWDKVDRIETALALLTAGQQEFAEHGWGNLPADLDDAVALTTTIRALQTTQAQILQALTDHVAWEMQHPAQARE